MSSRTRRRPARGPAGNPLIAGDTGNYGGPQGGAGDGASLSGDLASREFGVPQADIPGGIAHVVNPQTIPAKTKAKPERPADYHKYHGVASDDSGYEVPPDESGEGGPRPGSQPVPRYRDEAVPVRIVEGVSGRPRIISLYAFGPLTVPVSTGGIRIADRDPHRVNFWICKESSAGGVRISSEETISDQLGGLAILSTTLTKFSTQDEVYVANPSGSAAAVISWGFETEIEAAGTQPEQ